ncbi:MAG TPA: HEAT repeat domain-containing protein [Candidatus Eisenbacteria bacterium]|jgi:hypothetical protein
MSDDTYAQSKPFDALNSRGLAGKREYVRSLEQRNDAEALSLLVECLCDESWYLRELAEDALMRVGPSSSVVLLPLLEQGLWFTRTSAARVLGRFAHRDAVPPLFRLTDDGNETVAKAALEALVAIGHGGGTIRIARELSRQPPGPRRRRFEEISARDPLLARRIERMMRNDRLMSIEGGDAWSDDSPEVRSSEEGLEWEAVPAPAATDPRPHGPEGRRVDTSA